jgi:hypothetical protein
VSVDPIKKRRSRFPPEDQDQFKQWSDDIVAALAGIGDPIERFRHGQGHETTTNLIGNGLLALLRFPSQFALLREDRSLMESAVEELLRYDSPAQNFSRLALEDIKVKDIQMSQGDRILLCYGAANRDPEQFEYPDQLDVRRPVRRH